MAYRNEDVTVHQVRDELYEILNRFQSDKNEHLAQEMLLPEHWPHPKDCKWCAAYDARMQGVGGLSQGQLAGLMNTARSYICKVESGRTSPNIPSLARFAAALDVPLVALVRLIEAAVEAGKDR